MISKLHIKETPTFRSGDRTQKKFKIIEGGNQQEHLPYQQFCHDKCGNFFS
jgi:ribosomal protein L19